MENLDAFARGISVGQRIASKCNQNFGAMVYEKILRRLNARRIRKRFHRIAFKKVSQSRRNRMRQSSIVGHQTAREGLGILQLAGGENGIDCGIRWRVANQTHRVQHLIAPARRCHRLQFARELAVNSDFIRNPRKTNLAARSHALSLLIQPR